MTVPDWDNPDVREGIRRMLALRAERMAAGHSAVGWKLAFGAPASLDRFGLSAPLVGFLTDATTHHSPGTVSCVGWQQPVAEPEIAVYIGTDLLNGSGDVAGAIAGLGSAIELANVHPPPANIETMLAGNIFHKAVVLGEPNPDRAGGLRHDLRARLFRNESEVANTTDLEALTGDLIGIVGHCAELLSLAGGRLAAGDVVIIGSIVPPLAIEPGQTITFELAPLPAISVSV